jgi:cell division protein FtsB
MEKLTAEVHSLSLEVAELRKEINDRTTATKRRTIVTAMVLVALAFSSWKAIDASADANRVAKENAANTEQLAELVERADADRAAVAVLACQNRNSGQKSIRDAFESVWVLLESASPGPRTQEFIDNAREALSVVPDRDCDGDGAVNGADYLYGTEGIPEE